MQYFGELVANSENNTIPILLRGLDNSELIGLTATDVDAAYLREGDVSVNIPLHDLLSVLALHEDGGWIEYDSLNQPGIYRLDLPDEAVKGGADWVLIGVTTNPPTISQNYHERFSLGYASIDIESAVIQGNLGLQNTYILPEDADDYFSTKITFGNIWDVSTYEDKLKALQHATKIIDNLRYIDDKANIDGTQQLEFPRTGMTSVPSVIQYACAEIAYNLLNGVDIEKEINKLYIESSSLSIGRTAYNRQYIPEHYRAGVPSAVAWIYLKPYLAKSRILNLKRSS